MKKRSFIAILLLAFGLVGIQAQSYNMGSSASVTTCSGTFYDSGGAFGNYSKDENFTMTFYPATAGAALKFDFTTFEIEYHSNCNKDYFRIYDGENTSATMIGEYCGTDNPGEILATGPTGAITFTFKSDNKNSVYIGWAASIECVSIGSGFSGVWTGSVSNDWNIGGNWDDGNVPGVSTDVTIPSAPAGSYFPETNSGSSAVCNNLTIESGAHLHIPATNELTVSGTLINQGGEAGLVIKSNASGTGSLLHNSANVNATVERYLTHSEWHFIGSPVASENAGIFVLSSGHSDIFLKTHEEATNTWGAFIVDPATPLLLGRGYEVWVGDPNGIQQDETVAFTGALNNGDYTTGSNGFYDLEYTTGHGLNLICNPYPSALNGNIGTWDTKFVANSIWVWDPSINNYVYWNGSNGINGDGYGTLTNGIIPAMQAFFVLATKDNINTHVTLPQSSRLHSTQPFYKSTNGVMNTLQLSVSGNGSKDGIFLSFSEEATPLFDESYDVYKMFGMAEAPQLYSVTGEELFSVNTQPLFDDNIVMEVGFTCDAPGVYELEAGFLESFENGLDIHLEDMQENTIINLKETAQYSFLHNPANSPDRFKVHFGLLNDVAVADELEFQVYAAGDRVHVLNKLSTQLDLHIFNILGQKVMQQEVDQFEEKAFRVSGHSGYYFVRILTPSGVFTQKVYIQ